MSEKQIPYVCLTVVVVVGWTTESLQDWGKYARISIPGMLMLCIEWWAFEIGVILTGRKRK